MQSTPASTSKTSSEGHDTPADTASGIGDTHVVSVHDGSTWHDVQAEHGQSLRAVLREHDLSPHGWLTEHVNCRGEGHCAACAVEVDIGGGEADQWLDAFLDEKNAGRLACQIEVTEDMAVRV